MFLGFVGLSAGQFHGYLFERMGFFPLQIGILLFSGYAAGIVAPIVQVRAIRWLRGPRRPLMLILAGAGLGMAFLPHVHGFFAVAMIFFMALFCTASISTLITACSLEVTRDRGRWLYFVIRTLGTIGYLVGCVASYFRSTPESLPFLYLGFGGAFIAALAVATVDLRPADPRQAPEDAEVVEHPRAAPGFRRAPQLFSDPLTARLLWTLGVMNFANAMVTLAQGNYLASRFSGGQSVISEAWIVATFCEIPLMLFCAWLMRRHGLRAVITFGLLGTVLKLVLTGIAGSRGVYFLGLMVHGCFFSGALVGFNLYVDQRFPVADRPSLQALGTLFYQGIPTALAGLAVGTVWHFWGLRSVFWIAGMIAMMTGVTAFKLLPRLSSSRA